MAALYDALEGRDPAARESELMARLPEQIAHARAKSSRSRFCGSRVSSAS